MSRNHAARDAFLQPIRHALGRGDADVPSPPEVDHALVRLASADEDLPARFETNALASGMNVQRLGNGALVGVIQSMLHARSAGRVACEITALGGALNSAGVALTDWRNIDRATAFDLDVTISGVAAALAETGSLVVEASPDSPRLLSLIAPLHIAVVPVAAIVPDMLDYLQRFADKPPHDLPAGQVIITGPSKTADIEGVLVPGVHGPGEVEILIVDE